MKTGYLAFTREGEAPDNLRRFRGWKKEKRQPWLPLFMPGQSLTWS